MPRIYRNTNILTQAIFFNQRIMLIAANKETLHFNESPSTCELY